MNADQHLGPRGSQSIREFWRRWHISLSTWFRDYLYIPMGGSRHGDVRTYCNLITVFFLCGLWHGAAWSFIAFGLCHGVFLSLERAGLGGFIEKLFLPFRYVYTQLVVMVGWVIFRAETLTQAGSFLKAMVGFGHGTGMEFNHSLYLDNELKSILVIGTLFSLPWIPWLTRLYQRYITPRTGLTYRAVDSFVAVGSSVALLAIFLASVLYLSEGTYNPFIYFRF